MYRNSQLDSTRISCCISNISSGIHQCEVSRCNSQLFPSHCQHWKTGAYWQILKAKGQSYLPKHLSTWWPAETLTEPVHEPKHSKRHDSGWPGKGDVYGAYNEEPGGEEPASAEPVRKHSADKLTDSVGQSLTAGDQPCITGNRKRHKWKNLLWVFWFLRKSWNTALQYNRGLQCFFQGKEWIERQGRDPLCDYIYI